MYRCTECNKEYSECPDFCDCGNDSFEEIYEEEEYYEPVRPVKHSKPKLSEEEIEEMQQEALDKKKALITIVICLLLSIIVLFLPPYPQKKMEKVKQQAKEANIKLPDISTYWDNTLPSQFRKPVNTVSNLPVLNSEFGRISGALKDYLKYVGGEFSKKWTPAMVKGTGECKVEFTINKEGGFTSKRIIVTSNNESLDDSVLLALSAVTAVNVPPEDYKGERILLSFKITDSGSKIYFPTK